jgi:50S ribosomal subunit-associated GTPase HflX
VWNKLDRTGGHGVAAGGIGLSAKTGAGMDRLEAEIRSFARPETARFALRIPYTEGAAIAMARARFRILEEKAGSERLALTVAGQPHQLAGLERFLAPRTPGKRGPKKIKGGAARLPPAPELPHRRSF